MSGERLVIEWTGASTAPCFLAHQVGIFAVTKYKGIDMSKTTEENQPWGCTKCKTIVFIPTSAQIEGGVCSQQKRGCSGEIVLLADDAAALARKAMAGSMLEEQPWLTLVFAEPSADPRGAT